MNENDNVCLCFHVSKRKVVQFCKREKPVVASLISECLSAGTGCGWCVPYLKSLHRQCLAGGTEPDLPISPQEYAKQRIGFRQSGKREIDE